MATEVNEGCYIQSHQIFLIDNRGVVFEQMSQWLLVILLPLATFAFAWAGVQNYRTHGSSFDSKILFISGVFNLIYFWEEFVMCSAVGNLLKVVYATFILVYFYHNFEKVLDKMETDLEDMEPRERRTSSSFQGADREAINAVDLDPLRH